MGYIILTGCILAPFLLALGALGALGAGIEWYNQWKREQKKKPRLGQYPEPKRRGTVYGDGPDDFITNEEGIA